MVVIAFYHRVAALLLLTLEWLAAFWLLALLLAVAGWALWGVWAVLGRLRAPETSIRQIEAPEVGKK